MFQIKHRFTGEVVFECELSAEVAGQSYSLQLGFAVRKAVSARADLAGAYLARANLAGANLADANLAGAYLAGAYLARANLAGAYLARANLAGANLAGANLADANLAGAVYNATPEEIERLDAVREIVLNKPERLNMRNWHSDNWTPDHTPEEEHSCGSAHCIAGWLQALSPDPEIRKMDAETAGRKLAPSACGMFFQSDSVALQWLKDRAYANSKPEGSTGAETK